MPPKVFYTHHSSNGFAAVFLDHTLYQAGHARIFYHRKPFDPLPLWKRSPHLSFTLVKSANVAFIPKRGGGCSVLITHHHRRGSTTRCYRLPPGLIKTPATPSRACFDWIVQRLLSPRSKRAPLPTTRPGEQAAVQKDLYGPNADRPGGPTHFVADMPLELLKKTLQYTGQTEAFLSLSWPNTHHPQHDPPLHLHPLIAAEIEALDLLHGWNIIPQGRRKRWRWIRRGFQKAIVLISAPLSLHERLTHLHSLQARFPDLFSCDNL